MDYVYVNILLVIACYRFLKCYHWGKLSKRYIGFPCIVSYNCM